jgi:hypothetical protein
MPSINPPATRCSVIFLLWVVILCDHLHCFVHDKLHPAVLARSPPSRRGVGVQESVQFTDQDYNRSLRILLIPNSIKYIIALARRGFYAVVN